MNVGGKLSSISSCPEVISFLLGRMPHVCASALYKRGMHCTALLAGGYAVCSASALKATFSRCIRDFDRLTGFCAAAVAWVRVQASSTPCSILNSIMGCWMPSSSGCRVFSSSAVRPALHFFFVQTLPLAFITFQSGETRPVQTRCIPQTIA